MVERKATNHRKYTRSPDKVTKRLVQTTSEEIAATGLTEMQWKFCHHYVNSLNGTDAAIQAGYSAKSAAVRASRLLSSEKIQDYIGVLGADRGRKINARLKKIHIDKERILVEMAYVAFFDPRGIFKKDGSLKPITDWPEECARALGTINNKELYDGVGDDRIQIGELKTIRPWDKLKALEMLAKHVGMFQTNVNVKQSGEISHKVKVQEYRDKYANLSIEEMEQLQILQAKVNEEPKQLEENNEQEEVTASIDEDVIDAEFGPVKVTIEEND